MITAISHHIIKYHLEISTGLGSSYLTPVTASDMLHLYVPTTDVSTLTDPSLQATPSFSIELLMTLFSFTLVLKAITF